MFPPFLNSSDLDLIKRAPPVLLVSGGADSVFLFHQFLTLKIQAGIKFRVLHFNHHLRAAESDGDQQFVRQLCARHRIPLTVIHLRNLPSSHVQETARHRRQYHLFRLHQQRGWNVFVTAHHQDDVLETLFMKIGRGAGIKGLRGIPRQQIIKKGRDEICLYRPLIDMSKKEILSWLKGQRAPFCTDSSNLKPVYLRNAVRLGVLAQWHDETARNRVLASVKLIQVIDDYFHKRRLFLNKRYPSSVPLAVWETWPQELQFRFFRDKMAKNGFTQQVEYRHYLKIVTQDTIKLTLGEAVLLKDASGCYFFNRSQQGSRSMDSLEVQTKGAYFWGRHALCLAISLLCSSPSGDEYRMTCRCSGKPQSPLRLIINADDVPLRVSLASPSDLFKPFGHKTAKPLKKFLVSRHIHRFERLFWPVLRNKQNQILAVLGLEVGEDFRASTV
ncbi:MAG TPA: tRNA lysidine(34) synthetase TilS [bacterium]|nr:tRNA lysidine(34) synthetase TilS [bacterium]